MSEDLLLYAQLGRADHISRLVAEGVDPDWRREDGVTTLMMAAMTGRLEVMNSLLDSGATIDLQSPDGTSALLAACTFARTTREVAGVELLIGRGANPNLANAEGNDALMLCARHGLVEAIVILIKAGADPLRANRYGTTALMQAARGHLIETVRMLIRAGANRAQVDESGLNASRYACELGAPPAELATILTPSDLGSLEVRHVSSFSRPDFKIALLGSWNETQSPNKYEFLEVTGERQITVDVTQLPAELDPDECQDAIGRRVREQMASVREEAGDDCSFTEVRFFAAPTATQARWSASSPKGAFFVAVCIYATPMRFVTLSYRDFRPNLNDETRGRQASESVASFRVK